MKIFGYEILPKQKYNDLKKELQKARTEIAILPNVLLGNQRNNANGEVTLPRTPEHNFLTKLSRKSDVLRNILFTLQVEIFRKGLIITEESKNNEKIKSLLQNSNPGQQTLEQVLKNFEHNLNTYDDGFLVVGKSYTVSENEVLDEEAKSVVSVNPDQIGILMDGTGELGRNEEGTKLYFPLNDRTCLLRGEQEKQQYMDKHGTACLRAGYQHRTQQSTKQYYAPSEVIHEHKYTENLGFGESPILSVWQKVVALLKMDEYVREYYDGDKPPNGILAMNTTNQNSLKDWFEWMKDKTNQDPHLPVPLGVEDTEGNSGTPTYLSFDNTLKEMEFTRVRNEFRNQIGAVYRVSPMFQNDRSESSGMNNDSLEIAVTDRGVEMGMKTYNREGGVLDTLTSMFGLGRGVLRLGVEDTQDRRLQQELMRRDLENAERALRIGLDVEMTSDGVVFEPGQATLQPHTMSSVPSLENNDDGVGVEDALVNKKKEDDAVRRERRRPNQGVHKDEGEGLVRALLDELDLESVDRKEDLERLQEQTDSIISRYAREEAQQRLEEVYKEETKKILGKGTLEPRRISDVFNPEVFTGLKDDTASKIRSALQNSYTSEGFDVKRLEKELRKLEEFVGNRAELVARTETSKVQNLARKDAYKEQEERVEGEFLYEHIGPSDNRTTKVSQRIKNRTRGGVTWDEYVNIVREESSKEFPDWTVDAEAPLSHYQSRHTFVTVGTTE